ncbi:MAG: nucleotide exchange factor GrpE, partial [Victivallales bacterium]|nr:nucleotide exchange factor GrpE [Victivallales bacterium]
TEQPKETSATEAEQPKEAPAPETPQEEPPKPSAEQLLKEAQEKTLRVMAEFDNYRKRIARETVENRERAKINVIASFLPVYDYFTMAMEQPDQDLATLRAGMQMIQNEFTRALNNLGVKEIPSVGEKFDPQLHDATKSEPSEEVPEGVIISQWKKGYKVGDKLVRPAMVVVSAGPAKPEPEVPAEESPAEGASDSPRDGE